MVSHTWPFQEGSIIDIDRVPPPARVPQGSHVLPENTGAHLCLVLLLTNHTPPAQVLNGVVTRSHCSRSCVRLRLTSTPLWWPGGLHGCLEVKPCKLFYNLHTALPSPCPIFSEPNRGNLSTEVCVHGGKRICCESGERTITSFSYQPSNIFLSFFYLIQPPSS